MKQKGFTLIELLVVIVIIGILSTISTATFNGYFAKARDVERQTFVQSASRIIIASQLEADTKDYNLTPAEVIAQLEANGLSVPGRKSGINYHYIHTTPPSPVPPSVLPGPSLEFVFFVCKEETLGETATEVSDIAFVAGDYQSLQPNLVHPSDAEDVCGITPDTSTYPHYGETNPLN